MPESQFIVQPVPEEPGGYRHILRVAYPLMISMGSFTLMQFVDRIFLSWYSATAIQAAVPAGILSFTFICGFMALAGYSNTFVAQYYGSGNPDGCSRATAQAVWLALLSWPVMLMLIPFGRQLIISSGHPSEIIGEELSYFTILMIGSVTSPLGAAVSGFYTGRGLTLVTMSATVVSNLVNLVLDYALIFGHWGFPEMGIEGAAWASVIAGLVLPAILFILYFSRGTDAVYATRSTFRFEAPLFRRMLRYGIPAGVHLALDLASFAIFVMLTGRMGAQALAASNIALSINMLAFLPMIGIAIATAAVVGQFQGRRESGYAERACWTALKLGTTYMGLVGLTYILFPEFYISLFTIQGSELSLDEVLPIGRILLILTALWGLADASNLILAGALKGAGDTRFVMYYSLAVAWGFLVTGQVLIVIVFKLGIFVAWGWTAVYIAILASGYLWRFRSGKWKNIDLLGSQVPIQPDRPGAEALVAGD